MSNDEDGFDDSDDDSLLQAAVAFQSDRELLNKLPSVLRDSLLPFQRDGVLFGLQHDGCLLLADEMGLGKTLQAISIGAIYESEWPMLVVVPSSMKYVWLDEIQRWLPHLTPDEIHLVKCAEDVPDLVRCKISIVSYGLFQYKRFFGLLENLDITFKVIICDESHYLKNWKSLRTKHLVKLLQGAKRRILLTGTPALARPEELYTQINSIKPGYFGSYTRYCEKYCQGHYNYRLKRFDVSGASNLEELHLLLTDHVMIRRLKSKVLTQLPAKQRQKISFDLPASAMREVEKVKLRLEEVKVGGNDIEVRSAVMELYHQTGLAKIPACVEYIKEMLKQGSKFLVFAHHLAMLDAIERELVESKTDYIRIDGSVSSLLRQEYVRRFQSVDSCKVAVLSIQAAGVGLTLTAASLVVFCELHWSPGVLHQAEDRAHRISQKNAVNVYYLIGLGTIDETLWKKLNRKVDVVGKTLEGQGGDMNTDETDNDDIKSVLAACTGNSPTKRQQGKKNSPVKKPSSLSFCPGQTKLTPFLNMSIDEDFTDPRISGPSKSTVSSTVSSTQLNSSRVDEILSQAEMKRDRLQMSKLEKKTKKRGRGKERSEDGVNKRGRGGDKGLLQVEACSKYFKKDEKERTDVIDIDSSSDGETDSNVVESVIKENCSTDSKVSLVPPNKSTAAIIKETKHLDLPPVIIIDESSTSSSKDHPQTPPETLQSSPEAADGDSQPTSSSDSGIDHTQEHPSPVKMITEDDDDDGDCSDTDLFSDRPVDTLQFSVSAHTDRIYFYDYTGIYLEVNCLLQDLLDDTSLPDLLTNNPYHKDAAQDFARHWAGISKATQTRLHNKIVSDLDEELKKVFENRAFSTTRNFKGPKTAADSKETAGHSVKLRKLNVGKKTVEIEQRFSELGDPLCLSCESVVIRLKSRTSVSCVTRVTSSTNSELSKLPFQGRFCSLDCSERYGVKANSHSFVRKILFDLEFGVCQTCGLDTNRLLKQLRLGSQEEKVKLLNSTNLKSLTEKQKRNIVVHATEGLLWQADHIVPVAEGGGQCDIDNFRTLCTVCHKVETKKLMARLRVKKDKETNKKEGILDIRHFLG